MDRPRSNRGTYIMCGGLRREGVARRTDRLNKP